MPRFELRPYQKKGIEQAYAEFMKGHKRVIFWLATGGGKTFTFCSIINETVEKGGAILLVVKRRDLIDQASQNLKKWGINHGVYMSGHRRFRPRELVQVCSIDTLDARSTYPLIDKNPLLIIDECQDCRPTGKKYVRLLDQYPNSPVLGFTATPYADNSMFQSIISPIYADELMAQGNLVPVKIFTPEGQIDTSNVRVKKNGKFDEKELFQASSSSAIIGDFVRDWKLYSQGRPTVLFAVNVEHSKMIAEAFNEAGIKAVHADAKTKGDKRKRIFKKLVKGEIQVVCNVDVFSTGLDVPEVACIQVCRPTQSLIWYIQAVGRGLRPAPHVGKENCIIIDNAGNTFKFGSPYRRHEAKIGKRKEFDPDQEDVTIRECKQCHFVFSADEKICPECNYVNPPVIRKIKQEEGELVEYKMSEEELKQMEKSLLIADCHKLKAVAKRTPKIKNKRDWILYRIRDKHGVDKMETYQHDILNILPEGEL